MVLNLDYDINPIWAKRNLKRCSSYRRDESKNLLLDESDKSILKQKSI